jgi:hypothetical protein
MLRVPSPFGIGSPFGRLLGSAYYALGFNPSLAFDFEKDYYRVNDVSVPFDEATTHTRASSATFVDSAGVLQAAGTNVARTGHHFYKDGVLTKGALFEPSAATNRITNSDGDANWTPQSATITQLAGAYLGAFAGVRVASTGDSWNRYQYNPAGGWVNTEAAVFTVFYKSGTSGMARVSFRDGAAEGGGNETLVNGTVGSLVVTNTPAGGAEILQQVDHGDGIYSAVIKFTPNRTATTGTSLGFGPDTTVSGDDVVFLGADYKDGATPSSFVLTTGSEVTRAAEDVESDNLSYNSDAMWFSLKGYVTYADLGSAGQMTLFDWRDDANNRITVTLDTDGAETGEITLTVVSGGTSWSVAADYLSPGINVPFNIAWRVTDADINLAVGGTAATANTSPTSIPDLSSATAVFAVNGVQELFRQGVGNLGDTGIAEAST